MLESRCRLVFMLAILTATWVIAGCGEQEQGVFQGYVEGEFVYVAPGLSGRLETLNVARGDRVAAGDALFALESGLEQEGVAQAEAKVAGAKALLEDKQKGLRRTEVEQIQAELDKARASLKLAATELNRRRRLYADKNITKEELDKAATEHQVLVASVRELEAKLATAELGVRDDQLVAAQAEYDAALAALAQARWNLDQKSVPAPEAGLVFDTLYTPGEWLGAGSPVVVMLPPDKTKVRFFVHEQVAGGLRLGMPVMVTWDGMREGKGVVGEISYISPEVEYTPPVIYSQDFRHKLVIMVELSFDRGVAAELHPGQPVDVTLPEAVLAQTRALSGDEQ